MYVLTPAPYIMTLFSFPPFMPPTVCPLRLLIFNSPALFLPVSLVPSSTIAFRSPCCPPHLLVPNSRDLFHHIQLAPVCLVESCPQCCPPHTFIFDFNFLFLPMWFVTRSTVESYPECCPIVSLLLLPPFRFLPDFPFNPNSPLPLCSFISLSTVLLTYCPLFSAPL